MLAAGCGADPGPVAQAPRQHSEVIRTDEPRGRPRRPVPVGYGRVFGGEPSTAHPELMRLPEYGDGGGWWRVVEMHPHCDPVRTSVWRNALSECEAVARAAALLEREGYGPLPSTAASVHPTRRDLLVCAATDGVGSDMSCATLTMTRRNGSIELSQPLVGLNQAHWFVSFARTRLGAPRLVTRMLYDGRDLSIVDE